MKLEAKAFVLGCFFLYHDLKDMVKDISFEFVFFCFRPLGQGKKSFVVDHSGSGKKRLPNHLCFFLTHNSFNFF